MPNFTLQNIGSVRGKQIFDQLVIDGEPQLDCYEKSLQRNYQSKFRNILSWMNRVADNHPAPETKFKDITPNSELIKEYEFKNGDLRIYAIKNSNGKIIVLGGYKNSQAQDIVRFRSLKKQYLDSLK